MKTTEKQKQAIRVIIETYFKDKNNEPYKITDGQCDIFAAITKKGIHYVWISAPTRYGKTEVTALALIYLAVFEKLKIPVVAGSAEKAKKIMEYILQHLPDHPELYQGLLNVKGLTEVHKLKISASKDTLRWSSGGWIYITSVDSRRISGEGEGVVGEGGDLVILEEAGLIKEKNQFSKIVRMTEGDWRKLVMIGNCVEKSVFEDAWNNDLYTKVRIDLDQAKKEGRFTEQELKDKKSQTTKKDWKRYYEVIFPDASEFAYFKPSMYEVLPNDLEYWGSLDPALGESKKGSLTGINVLGKDKKTGQIYQVLSIGKILTPDESIREIFNLPFIFHRFGVESVLFQKYFLKVIDDRSKAEGKHIPFVGIEQSKKKEERIESLEPFINTKQILFKGNDIIWEHMESYPDCPLDVLDSLEICARLMGLTGRTGLKFEQL